MLKRFNIEVTTTNNIPNLLSRRDVCKVFAVLGVKALGLTPSLPGMPTVLGSSRTDFFMRRSVVTKDGIMGLVDVSITDGGIKSDTRIVRGLINDDHVLPRNKGKSFYLYRRNSCCST